MGKWLMLNLQKLGIRRASEHTAKKGLFMGLFDRIKRIGTHEKAGTHPLLEPAKVTHHGETGATYDFVERINQYKREQRYEEALSLLAECVESWEAGSAQEVAAGGPGGVAPWYYEQMAIIYRKEKRYADEVEILKRYAAQKKAPGNGPKVLAERLKKARLLLSNSKAKTKVAKKAKP